MPELELFRASLDGSGGAEILLVPYGKPTDQPGGKIQFDQGSITLPDSFPISVDHGEGVLDRIGVGHPISKPDGLYARVNFAETQSAQDVRALMEVGAITDVSAGILVDESRNQRDSKGVTHKFGTLDHGAIVGKAAFGDQGSKVLAVHNKGAEMPENVEAPVVEPVADESQNESELIQLSKSVADLRKVVTEFSIPGNVKEIGKVQEFANTRDFILTLAAASKGDGPAAARMEKYALADDTTTTAVGVVPDFLSTEVLEIVDTERPYVQTLHTDDIGTHGMSVVYPKVISGPTVAVQATQKTEVESTAMDIDPFPVALLTYSGASDVARQLIERSQPSFVDILFRHYASAYAQVTDAAAIAAGVAGAGNTAILADLGAAAGATYAAFLAASMDVLAGVRRPATHACLSIDRWTELLSLVDTDGRPLIVFNANGPSNAQGQAGFNEMSGQYAGLTVYVDPNAAVGTTLVYNAEKYAGILEQAPVQMRAEVVSLLGFDMGVYGLFAHALHQADGGSTLTVA